MVSDGRQLLLNWNGEIHVTSATGGTSVNLTNHPANDSAPRWSRDGARIAFTSNRDGAPDLYVMNADGSHVLRLNTGVPIASPDGTRVAFSCAADPLAPANYDICAINTDGTSFARLTSGPGYEYQPDWSPDGSRIIFTDETDGAHLVMMNPAGGDVTVVNHIWLAEHPRWSPDGTRFAFVNFFWPEDVETTRTRFVTIMNADGSGAGSRRWADWPIWRPFSSGINYRPAASFSFQCDGPTCTLDASGSADADGTVAEYGWRFADGTTAGGPTVTRTFGLLDRWVSLRVMDDDAALGESGKSVNRPPVAAFTVQLRRPHLHLRWLLRDGSGWEYLVSQLVFRRWPVWVGSERESHLRVRWNVRRLAGRDRLQLPRRQP